MKTVAFREREIMIRDNKKDVFEQCVESRRALFAIAINCLTPSNQQNFIRFTTEHGTFAAKESAHKQHAVVDTESTAWSWLWIV